MELTNYSFLQSRRDHIQSITELKVAPDRLSKGNRLDSGKRDVGALGVDARLRPSSIHDLAEKINLQNFYTSQKAQADGLSRARTIYNRMGVLASRVLNPTNNEHGNQQLNKEFSELSRELDNLVAKKVNGNLLFGGKSADFTDGLTDTNATGVTPLRESQDVQSTSGKISISLSPGGAAVQIWVFQGKLPSELDEYFDASTYLNNGNLFDPTDVARLNELNNKLYSHFNTHGIFTTGPWQTEGTASDNNFDTFEVEYDSCNVKVTPSFDDDNNASFGKTLYDNLGASGDLRTNIPPGDSTFITVIGVNAGNTAIYNVKASFTPTLPYIAAAQSRYQNEIESFEENEVTSEASVSRIPDTDFSKEAFNFTKSKLKSEMFAQMMSKTSRMKDLLIPLTTNHFRSHILNSRS